MRVAINARFLCYPHTGSGAYLRDLLAAMPEAAPSVEATLYVTRGDPEPETRGLPYRVRPVPSPPALRGNWAKLFFEQVSFPEAAAADGCDLAHVPYFAPPLRCRLPVVATVHDLIPLLFPAYRSGLLAQSYSLLVATAARRSARLIADSDCTKRDIVRWLRVHPDRVPVAHLAAGPHCRPVTNEAALAAVRRKYGLPPRYLLHLGLDRRKGVEVVLQAYRRLAERPDVPSLVIAGRLPDGGSAAVVDPRPLVARMGLEGRVLLPGAFDEADKPALLSGAVCFVYPSLYEGFGLPPLEAMACGTPVVSTRAASLPEVCGDAAVLVRPGDSAALAEALGRVVADEALRRRLSASGRERAASFSWSRTAAATAAVYGEAARSG